MNKKKKAEKPYTCKKCGEKYRPPIRGTTAVAHLCPETAAAPSAYTLVEMKRNA